MALTVTIPNGPVQLSDTVVEIKVNTSEIQGSLYEVLFKVTPEDNEQLPGGPFEEGVAPDSNGDAKLNISGLLRRVFVPSFNIASGIVCTERADIPYKVSIDVGESYVDASNERQKNWAELEGSQYEIVVLRGGLSIHRQNIYQEEASTFYADYIQGGKWLTELPNPCTIAPDKLIKLWYMTPEAAQQNLNLVVNYTLKDGTTGNDSFACTINPESIYEFDVDPYTLGLDVASANPVTSYDVVLKNGAVEVIETFTIELDYDHFEESFQLFYRSKFSGIDPIWLHGKSEDQFPATHVIASRTPETSDNSFNRTQVVSSKSSRRQWSINVGHKEYNEIMSLRSAILSREMWLLDGSHIVPVNIESSNESLAKKESGTHDYTLILTEAHESKYM